MKLFKTLALIAFLIPHSPVFAGNDHGSGDPTQYPSEKIPFPGKDIASQKLREIAKHAPQLANAALDMFTACEAFKTDENHKDGFFAIIATNAVSEKCFVTYFKKFYNSVLTEEQQAEITLHEAIHYATRYDPRSHAAEFDRYIQSIARKVMLGKWPELYDVEREWKVAEPKHSFYFLSLEKIAAQVRKTGALSYPDIAQENHANEMLITAEVVGSYDEDTSRRCSQEYLRIITRYSGFFDTSIANNQALITPADGSAVHLQTETGSISGEFYQTLTNKVINRAFRTEINAELISLKGGDYCKIDIYDNGSEVIGIQGLILLPPVQKPGSLPMPRKALVIWFEYVHS